MAKTEWIGHTRVPRTWLLDDGSTIQEPLLERTTGGRRVRSVEDKTLAGSYYDEQNLAFTAVVRKAKERGRTILCEAHDIHTLKARVKSKIGLKFPDEPPMLHLTNDFYAVGGTSQDRCESDTTRFWTAWEHPALPIHFISVNGIETSYYTAATMQALYHVPLFPALGVEVGKGKFYTAPSAYEVTSALGNPDSNNPLLSRTVAYWEGCEFWQHFPLQTTIQIVDGRREALRLMLIQATQIGRMDTLEVPDLWTRMGLYLDPTVDDDNRQFDIAPLVELRKTETNIDDDTIESFKAYVTGADSAAKAAALYKQMRNELTHAGIVLGEIKDDRFVQLLSNGTKPFTTTLTGARNTAEGKTANRRNLSFTDRHEVVVDLVTGYITVGCPHGDHPDGMPVQVVEAWEEAHTIAALSGKGEAFIDFAAEYLRIKAENRVLTEALARRK